MISTDPLPPGSVYSASLANSDQVALTRIEIAKLPGTGRLRIGGQPPRALRDSFSTGYNYLRAQRTALGIERDLESYDFHIQAVDLLGAGDGTTASVASFVALYSLLRDSAVLAGLVILGDVTIQGNIQPLDSLIEPLQLALDNGARRVLISTSNRRQFLKVPGDIIEKIDPIFYSDPVTAAFKAINSQ